MESKWSGWSYRQLGEAERGAGCRKDQDFKFGCVLPSAFIRTSSDSEKETMVSRCFAVWRIRGKCPEWEKTNNTGTKWLSPCVEPDIVLGLPSGDLSAPHNGPAMQISLLSQRYR